jgi:transposase-like protein
MPLPVAELVIDLQQEVEKMATDYGMLVMNGFIKDEVERIAGTRYRHEPERKAYRSGNAGSWVYYAGRKVSLKRPRVRDENGEVPLATVKAFQRDGKMQRRVAGRVLAGVKMRRYEQCIDDVCEGYGIKKSSVSRHWVNASAKALRDLAERDLSDLKLAVILIDGLRFRDIFVVVALGVDFQGCKHVLGLFPGATENTTTCQDLLDDLMRRGLDAKAKYLFVIDGAKALRSAIRKTFGSDAVIQRCQVHKKRNVKEHLPKNYHRNLSMRLSVAYGMTNYADAKAELHKTVTWLEGISASAAASLEEGMEETLTLHRLGIPPLLRKSLSSTNLIESCFSTTRERSRNVKRWRNEDQVLRWTGTMLLEAEKGFRRIRGFEAMSALLSKLEAFSVDDAQAVA